MPKPRHYVTELRDAFDDEGMMIRGRGEKRARYMGLIVEVGSILRPGEVRLSVMRCAIPSRRKRCGGRLYVEHDVEGAIVWSCDLCDHTGVIRRWEGTDFDLRSAAPVSLGERRATAVVPDQELWAMRAHAGGYPELRRRLAEATDLPEGYCMFHAVHDELCGLQGRALNAAEGEQDEQRRLLERFATRMDAFRTTMPDYFDAHEPTVDLRAAEEAGTPPEVIGLAVQLAAEQGRNDLTVEDLLEARRAHEDGARRILH